MKLEFPISARIKPIGHGSTIGPLCAGLGPAVLKAGLAGFWTMFRLQSNLVPGLLRLGSDGSLLPPADPFMRL